MKGLRASNVHTRIARGEIRLIPTFWNDARVRKGADGNPEFLILDPEGQVVATFRVEEIPGDKQAPE